MKLEIAIVTRNRPEILDGTLERIEKLGLINQVLVVDGSDDNLTKKICDKYNLDYYRQKSSGMTAARNEALRHTNKPYIVYIDDDVRVSGSWYDKIKSELEKSDIIGATGKLEDEDLHLNGLAKTVRKFLFGSKEKFGEVLDNGVINGDFFYDKRKEVDHMPGCNMAYEVESLKACGGFEEEYDVGNSYREDTVASHKVSKKGKLIYNPEASLNHIKAQEGRNEKKRLFYSTYLTRYFITDQNIVSGFKNTLDHLLVTGARHAYYFSRSLRNFDNRYIFYLKGELRGILDFKLKNRKPQSYI